MDGIFFNGLPYFFHASAVITPTKTVDKKLRLLAEKYRERKAKVFSSSFFL